MSVVECSRCHRAIEPDEPVVFITTTALQSMYDTFPDRFEIAPRWHWRCVPKPLKRYAPPVIARRRQA